MRSRANVLGDWPRKKKPSENVSVKQTRLDVSMRVVSGRKQIKNTKGIADGLKHPSSELRSVF